MSTLSSGRHYSGYDHTPYDYSMADPATLTDTFKQSRFAKSLTNINPQHYDQKTKDRLFTLEFAEESLAAGDISAPINRTVLWSGGYIPGHPLGYGMGRITAERWLSEKNREIENSGKPYHEIKDQLYHTVAMTEAGLPVLNPMWDDMSVPNETKWKVTPTYIIGFAKTARGEISLNVDDTDIDSFFRQNELKVVMENPNITSVRMVRINPKTDRLEETLYPDRKSWYEDQKDQWVDSIITRYQMAIETRKEGAMGEKLFLRMSDALAEEIYDSYKNLSEGNPLLHYGSEAEKQVSLCRERSRLQLFAPLIAAHPEILDSKKIPSADASAGLKQFFSDQAKMASLGIAQELGHSADDYAKEAEDIRKLPAFARLKGLYQFAINYDDPSLKNRLRHTQSVAQIAGQIARDLGLGKASAQLATNIALMHDIGHPPFSHWGEVGLNEHLAEHGISWNHDTASLLSITDWSTCKALPNGLSLAPETVEGTAKRFWRYDPSIPPGRNNHSRDELPGSITALDQKGALSLDLFNHLEGQIAAQADRIAFNASDIQDGLRIGRLTPEMLKMHFPLAYATLDSLITEAAEEYKQESASPHSVAEIKTAIESNKAVLCTLYLKFSDRFVRHQIEDLLTTTTHIIEAKMQAGQIMNASDIRRQGDIVVDFSPDLHKQLRAFSGFCKKEIFSRATAPLATIVQAVVDCMKNGQIPLRAPYDKQLNQAGNEKDKLLVIAEYITRECSDREMLELAKQHAPEIYTHNFPGYESVEQPILSKATIKGHISKSLGSAQALQSVGMPTILPNQLLFDDQHSIPAVSSTQKYIVPIPEEGETIQVPYDGERPSGELYRRGEPIYDGKGNILTGKGFVFLNPEDDQWMVAKSGLQGNEKNVIIINDVTQTQAELLDELRSRWKNPEKPTVKEVRDLLDFAREIPLTHSITHAQVCLLGDAVGRLVDNRSSIQSYQTLVPALMKQRIIRAASNDTIASFDAKMSKLFEHGNYPTTEQVIRVLDEVFGGLNTMYPSDLSYTSKALENVPDYKETRTGSPYGLKRGSRSRVVRISYIDHPFELFWHYGQSERSYHGSAIIKRNDTDFGTVEDFRLLSSYEHPDGTPLKLSDIPRQPELYRPEYETNHSPTGDQITTLTIVGNGVSGIATITHLVESFKKQAQPGQMLRLNVIDSALSPAGLTYNRPDANIVGMANPIGILGILTEKGCVEYLNRDPQKWMQIIPQLKEQFDTETNYFRPNTIITHNQYGTYVRDHFKSLLREIESANLPIEINSFADRVVSTERQGNKTKVTLKSGNKLESDAVVYGVGNAVPRQIMAMGTKTPLDGTNGYYRLDDQAWSVGNINETDHTIVLGTANGALFGALWAAGNGYTGKFTLVSGSGEVPTIAGESKPYTRQVFTLDTLRETATDGHPITVKHLKKLMDAELAVARKSGHEWRDVVDSLAPDTNAIWRMMSDGEQKLFRTTYGTLWNNARYRIPNEHWDAVQKLQAEGRLEIVGGLQGVVPLKEGGFEVHVKNPDGSTRIIPATKIVNNTGPSKELSEMPECIQDLIARGDAKLHHAGGIDTDDHFRLLGKDGKPTPGLYAIGPIVSGAHLEAVTIPAIRGNATTLTDTLMRDLFAQKEVPLNQPIDRTLDGRITEMEQAINA